jgi:cell division protein FtsA
VERDLGVNFEQAEKFKVGLSDNTVPAAKREGVEAALDKTADVWIGGIELALSEFTKLDHLPHRMFLCGGGSSLDILMERLEEATWFKSLPFSRKPSVHHIRPDQVSGIKDSTGDVADHTFITAMGLLRVGMDTMQFSTDDGSIRSKIDKMLSV